MAENTDILVVGAGPIGLINAWGMKRLNPNLNIVILEKYEKYQRSHTLVMQAEQLEAIMKATQSEDDPTLVGLLKDLKRDPHIRTNKLQEIFTNLAKKDGVEIQVKHEVKKEEIRATLDKEYPNVKLIIGADGTHSVVSRSLYSEDNQVKHEFDYVLQLRYEIFGDEKAPGMSTTSFYDQMAKKGLIANEYVGNFENGKTPVTMQMMISKEDFIKLQKYTSKDPLKIFTQQVNVDIPRNLNDFIGVYLNHKIQDLESVGQLDKDSIRISVNEAPATHAKKVVGQYNNARVVLEGDAALGLSYFKGLNAGLEASARFLTIMTSAIKNSFADPEQTDENLADYQSWFNDFSPKKIKEVGQYSFWQIRSFMRVMESVRSIFNASMAEYELDLHDPIQDYFDHYVKESAPKNSGNEWKPFPHREYDLVKFSQWGFVPFKHTAKKIAKIFIDYFKPYKGSYQLIQDYKQPLVGLGNIVVGFNKALGGIFTLDLKFAADGFFTMFRGYIEVLTTPLTWFIKPFPRLIATAIHGINPIEKNSGMQKLGEYGHDYLDGVNGLTDSHIIYELLGVCNDLHRKFDKQVDRGQRTNQEADEYSKYSAVRDSCRFVDRNEESSKTQERKEKLIEYFSLFAPPKEKPMQEKYPVNSFDF